ncbi:MULTISPECIES: prealbumin-like fold domain-containing protein [Vagococcus]|uniref:Putative peptidoglycan bound protein (LPXTG motif) Lmo1115 homolog n=1 Tax=Vagococcus fluvialis bH819 TaxID=1255619 RepID=A0A1X6WS30_9ENTE|nr:MULTISPECIES: prealbumin-like fold domain-containing protein [Vagococcus]SLM87094.1 Putative peptidoglycan bound protein (LPXTG motif) Lmo1115 homolog [Vagococcus fluvialis bH819]
MSFKKRRFFLSVCILSALCTGVFASSSYAKEKSVLTEKVGETIELKKHVLSDETNGNAVQGADGLWYVVVENEETLLIPETPEVMSPSIKNDDEAIEVGVDKSRQRKADNAKDDVSDFEDIDVKDVRSLQSALNAEDFPFVDESEKKEASSTVEQDEIHEKTKTFFVERILEETKNMNDIPSGFKARNKAIVAYATSKLSTTLISPPSGYGWVFYIILNNGSSYTENYSTRKVINGKDAFCLEPGIATGVSYTSANLTSFLSVKQAERVSALVTAYRQTGGYNQTNYLATQLAIWDNVPTKPRSVSITPNWRTSIGNAKKVINNSATLIQQVTKFNRTSVTVNQGQNATFTITNSEKNVSISSVSNGGTAKISGKTITVNTNNATANQIKVVISKGVTEAQAKAEPQYVWNSGSAQKLVTGLYRKNVATLTVNVNRTGVLEVTKTGTVDGKPLNNVTFKIYDVKNKKDYKTGLKTNATGKLTVKDIPIGDYYLQETATVTGYTLDNSQYKFTITTKNTVSVPYKIAIKNNYSIAVSKTVSDSDEKNVINNTLFSDDSFSYEVLSSVIRKSGDKNLTKVQLTDRFDFSKVEVKEVLVLNEKQTNVTNLFDVKFDSTTGIVTGTAKATTLASADFYNHSYTLKTTLKFKESIFTEKKLDIKMIHNGKLEVGLLSVDSNNVSSVLPVYQMTVNHSIVDKSDKKTVLATMENTKIPLYRGEKYLFKAMSNGKFKINNKEIPFYFAEDLGDKEYNGKATSSQVVSFYYYSINHVIQLDEVTIDTKNFKNGLEAKVRSSLSSFIPNANANDLKAKIKLEVTPKKTQKVLYSKEYTLLELTTNDGIELKLPVENFLLADSKDDFSFKLIVVDKNSYSLSNFNEGQEFLSLEGYTASERMLTANSSKDAKLSYSGVVRTLVNRENPSKTEYDYETFNINLTAIKDVQSGYSREFNFIVNYQNPINKDTSEMPELETRLYVTENLLDTSMTLKKEKGLSYYEMEIVEADKEKTKQELSIKMPKIMIEEKTGNSYLSTSTNGSEYKLIEGGRGLYVPIWIDTLGVYSPEFQNVGVIGVNQFKFKVVNPMEVYAFMYATIGSKTVHKDSILLEPIYPDTKVPNGWTESQKKWLRN